MSQEERRNPEQRRSGPGGQRQRTGGQEARRRSQSRRRPRRRMGFGGAVLYVILVIGISALLAGLAWVAAGDVLALNKEPMEATITVEEGQSVGQVAGALRERGIVEHPLLFQLFAAVTGGSDKIAPGTYTLDTDMDYRAIITNMSAKSPTRATVNVTIPEGYTVLQIFQRLAENGVCTVEELKEVAAEYDYKFSFLQDVIPLGDYRRLEGYLFPDTYTFYQNDDPVNVLNKMILRFDEKFTDDMRQKVADSGHTIHEIIIVASLIEKETTGEDQTSISAVIWNRLDSNYRKLEIDATVQYILPERKEFLSDADTAIDDPYNTYVYEGLPAGPIANPGEASIRAAMNPEKGNKNYFYALGDDGFHHFFKTHQGQQDFIKTQEYYKNANRG